MTNTMQGQVHKNTTLEAAAAAAAASEQQIAT